MVDWAALGRLSIPTTACALTSVPLGCACDVSPADGWKPWEAPRLAVPPWCDLLSSEDGNDQWARLPQHPCAFLRNATAAALAAARPPPPPPPLAALAAEAGGGGEGAAGYQRGGFAGQDGSGGGVGEARGEQAAEEGAAEAGVGVEAGDAGGGR